jgi:4-hydroxy-tetrahydrodipicolinate synthase
MQPSQRINGVFAAALTPLNEDFSIQVEALPGLLHFLAQRGCHGALLFGTTGEGPSFSAKERLRVFQAVSTLRQDLPGFKLLAGTGTPSLDDTIQLTRAAFENGFDGVVVLPPYYFRKATDEGLYAWYQNVIQKSVPGDGVLLGYHIPSISGVSLSIDLLSRLKDAFPGQFGGLKDSSGEPDYTYQLDQRFGGELIVLTGSDGLLGQALEKHASGCITAMANLFSPLLREVWDAFHAGKPYIQVQAQLIARRDILSAYAPNASILKALLPHLHYLPAWPVRPPLLTTRPELVEKALQELAAIEC